MKDDSWNKWKSLNARASTVNPIQPRHPSRESDKSSSSRSRQFPSWQNENLHGSEKRCTAEPSMKESKKN